MAKYRIHLTGDAYYWWEVSFEHHPFFYRWPTAVHYVSYYQVGPGWPPPEMNWYQNCMTEDAARGLAQALIANPQLAADLCLMCNIWYPGCRHIRWNINRGENRLWMPPKTVLRPWPP